MPNTQRQPTVCTTTPPTVGPIARPIACAAAWTPNAVRSRPVGADVATNATLLACSIAAPAPWTARSPTSAASEGANAQPAEDSPNAANPQR